MKTNTFTINISAKKYDAVDGAAGFEAVIKIARLVNANSIAVEASHRAFGSAEGRSVTLREIKQVIVLLHKLNRKAAETLKELYPAFKDSRSYAAFVKMSDEGQMVHGSAPEERSYIDIKIISSTGHVASAIRKRDLVGSGLLLASPKDDQLSPEELEAEEAFYSYKDTADRELSPRIYNQALKTSYTWTAQFNHAALGFIRGQCKTLGLKVLEEQVTEIRETVGVH